MEKKNILYLWFGDQNVETISMRCFFIIRLLKLSGIEFDCKFLTLPNEAKKLNLESAKIPVLKYGDEFLNTKQMIDLCCQQMEEGDFKIEVDTMDLDDLITFEWAQTNLLGTYVHYLYGDEECSKKFFKRINKIYPEYTEEFFHDISSVMLKWRDYNSGISHDMSKMDQYVRNLLKKMNGHLADKHYWNGYSFTLSDLAVFSFVFLISNPSIGKFKEDIKANKYLVQWARRVDKLTSHDHSKMKFD